MNSGTLTTISQARIGRRQLPAVLAVPERPIGMVVFAHGRRSSRLSPRNQFVAHCLQQAGLAIGAIGEGGELIINQSLVKAAHISPSYLESERQRQADEIRRRQQLFRSARPKAPICGRSVILTDDGIATGSTMLAAIDVVHAQQPHELIVAVPVGPPERLLSIRDRCHRLICLKAPPAFSAVGVFYRSFDQVSDKTVMTILREHAHAESRASQTTAGDSSPLKQRQGER